MSPQLFSDDHEADRSSTDIAILMAEIGGGGMGKMRIHLMNGLVEHGYRVDLLLGKKQSSYNIPLDSRVRVYRIGTSHALFGVPTLARYLRLHRPRVLLTQRLRVNVLAWRARRLAGVATRLFASSETHESNALAILPPRKAMRSRDRIRKFLAHNDGLIAVSHGVAEDLADLTGWPVSRINVVPNPIVQTDVDARAIEPVDHPWFAGGGPPVVVAAGRLIDTKNFEVLIRAFAQLLRSGLDARLAILGEGPMRNELETLADELGIAERVDLPGFVHNLYAYFSRSALFVLPSALEGLGNVLVEAMAVGTPVVATDCPSGPAEILQGGAFGPLVPVGDSVALAKAMEITLASPPDPDMLRATARQRYSVERSVSEYLRALGLLNE